MFTTHQIVFINDGENAGTVAPVVPLDKFTGDLGAKVRRCLSFDNDMLVEINLYSVVNVTLPEWLPAWDWINTNIAYGYMWNRGVDPSWPESWQKGLLNLPAGLQVACAKLLRTKKFRSEFRLSLRNQLVGWLETPPEERLYSSPFSARQAQTLVTVHDNETARRADQTCYDRKLSLKGLPT
jgi:hypothetical protein